MGHGSAKVKAQSINEITISLPS